MGYGPMMKQREALTKRGVPAIDPNEINLINATQYRALVALRPERKLVLKHFPGGDELLEASEVAQIHCGDDKPIASWIDGFDAAIKSSTQPWGVMLSHASYNLWNFPGIKSMPEPAVPDFIRRAIGLQFGMSPKSPLIEIFSLVPASLNPLITTYLRKVKGYRGVIVGDWYNMRSISEFCGYTVIHPEDKDTVKFVQEDTTFLLAVLAGVNYVRPIRNEWLTRQAWAQLRDRHREEYAFFEGQLNSLILQTYNIVKTDKDPIKGIRDIEQLTFKDKVNLVADQAQGPFLQYQDSDEAKLSHAFEQVEKDFPDRDLYSVINRANPVLPNDIWERGCILTMMYRKCFVERLIGLQFPAAPLENESETEWFKQLMLNGKFRQTYDAIDWARVNSLELGEAS